MKRNWLLLLVCTLIALTTSTGSAQSSKKGSAPVQHYTIAGHISGMEGGHEATVVATASRNRRHAAAMHPDGEYILRSVTPGDYTLRPAHAGYYFSPSFHSVAITNHDVSGVNFTAHRKPTKKR